MPALDNKSLSSLSMFSGGGGFDLGFDYAGFSHVASYELLDFAAETISSNRPLWNVYGGDEGDVTGIDWRHYRGGVDVIHGGPPCQPFSSAGRQRGARDPRDMFPQFVRAVKEIEPKVFIAENVRGLAGAKFRAYVTETIVEPLTAKYEIRSFLLNAASFGVPQSRTRVVFIGYHKTSVGITPSEPSATHDWSEFRKNNSSKQASMWDEELPRTMGVRAALGLPDTGVDALSPTLRCSLTGPRGTTSILSSSAAQDVWQRLEIWPNGVGADRRSAQAFPAKYDHYRLSVEECALLQGFPNDWRFHGAVHKSLGQIGNSVAPPMAYAIAKSVSEDLKLRSSKSKG
ncbi:DNA (cytosine-5-)-methyltransferase [Luminiphilus sp.]|nr:DNA (cytosine-5-)-methyltransferase [Luminiphilus sp.]